MELNKYYSLIAVLLLVSFGFSSAFADQGLESVSFDNTPTSFLPKHVPSIVNPMTGEPADLTSSERQ